MFIKIISFNNKQMSFVPYYNSLKFQTDKCWRTGFPDSLLFMIFISLTLS